MEAEAGAQANGQRHGRSNRTRRRSRSRSSQHARNALLSVLLDSDNSDEAQGLGQEEPHPADRQPVLANVEVDGARPIPITHQAATVSQGLTSLPTAAGPLEPSHLVPSAQPPTMAAPASLFRAPGMRTSNVSFVAETPVASPLTESLFERIPATPTEELERLMQCNGLPLGDPGQQPHPSLQQQQQQVRAVEDYQQALDMSIPSSLEPPPAAEYAPPEHRPPAYGPSASTHMMPPPPPRQPPQAVQLPTPQQQQPGHPVPPQLAAQQSFNTLYPDPGPMPPPAMPPPPPRPVPPWAPPPSSYAAPAPDAAARRGHVGDVRSVPVPAVQDREPGGLVTNRNPPEPVTTTFAASRPAPAPSAVPASASTVVQVCRQGQQHTTLPLSPARARVGVQQPAPVSYKSPTAQANKAGGFASLLLTKSPAHVSGATGGGVNGAAAGHRSPAEVAPGHRSPLLQRTGGQPAGSHYPGLSLQPCKPSPRNVGYIETSGANGAGATFAAAGRGDDGIPLGHPGGNGYGGGSNGSSRARLNLADKLHAGAGISVISPLASELGQTLAPRASAVALPPMHFMPGVRGPPATSAAVAAPTGTPLHVTSTRPQGLAAAAAEDHTPACQLLRGLAAPTTAPPSSARSTPFDEDMFAALDSLERRVTHATAVGGGAGAAGVGAQGWGPMPPPQGDGQQLHAGQPAGPYVEGTVGAPITTAFELMQQQEQQHQQPQQQNIWPWRPPQPPQAPRQEVAQHGRDGPSAETAQQAPHAGAAAHCMPGTEHGQGSAAGGAGVPAAAAGPQHAAADASGRTPAIVLRGAGGVAAQGPVPATEPTPESGSFFAALDELEERHRRADALAAAAGPDGAEGPGAAAAAAGGDGHAAGAAAMGAGGGLAKESPLPVKQLAFTPVHAVHQQSSLGYQHQQQSHFARPPSMNAGAAPVGPQPHARPQDAHSNHYSRYQHQQPWQQQRRGADAPGSHFPGPLQHGEMQQQGPPAPQQEPQPQQVDVHGQAAQSLLG
ncbi:hypothetical protein Agub_g7431, partial [Astrephomene gubernaculifera]